jgi:hypothetical protein
MQDSDTTIWRAKFALNGQPWGKAIFEMRVSDGFFTNGLDAFALPFLRSVLTF